jgi:shikimate dehydrogenase
MSSRLGPTGCFPERGVGLHSVMRAELRFALLGDPVEHSRSPAIHKAALAELGLSGSYEARRSGQAGLATALDELRAGNLDGVNITMPLKAMAAAGADRLTPMAERSRSVNTLRFREGLVEGHSTDAAAARAVLEGTRFDRAAPILILGAGGAAAAVLIAFQGREVYLAARRDDLANQLAPRAGYEVMIVPFGTAVPGAIVVNATPLGMNGESLPSDVMSGASGLIDLAYGPVDPPATVEARRIGLPLVDGVEFLARQAGESFTWWTGMAAPLDVMLEAAKNG